MSSFGVTAAGVSSTTGGECEWKAGQLALELPTFDASITCSEAFERFRQSDLQIAVAIVDGGNRVLGLVNRLRFMAHYAQRFIPELFGRRSIVKLANSQPFIVDEHTSVEELAATITLDHPDALRECFVVTRDGRYLGIGTSEALIRSKLELLTFREKQLQEALYAAQQANQTKSNFLALMSHELRTPLNAIIGFSEVLASEMFGPHGNPRYGEYAHDIHGAGKHLLALINDILDLSKSEAGRLDLCLEQVCLAAIFDDCMRFVAERAREQKLTLKSIVPADLPCLEADALRLKQILLNLLSNAVKFTMPGGEVTISAGLGENGGIVIRVGDTGIGMAPDDIPAALEPFRQIASPMSRNVEGTGLGLSLVKTLTERHGGTLMIESALNAGTTVQLAFPASRTVGLGAAVSKTG